MLRAEMWCHPPRNKRRLAYQRRERFPDTSLICESSVEISYLPTTIFLTMEAPLRSTMWAMTVCPGCKA